MCVCSSCVQTHTLGCDNSTHVTEYCAVIGPALYRAAQQTAVKEVTRPLPSLAEWGVAMRDYILGSQQESITSPKPHLQCQCWNFDIARL